MLTDTVINSWTFPTQFARACLCPACTILTSVMISTILEHLPTSRIPCFYLRLQYRLGRTGFQGTVCLGIYLRLSKGEKKTYTEKTQTYSRFSTPFYCMVIRTGSPNECSNYSVSSEAVSKATQTVSTKQKWLRWPFSLSLAVPNTTDMN